MRNAIPFSAASLLLAMFTAGTAHASDTNWLMRSAQAIHTFRQKAPPVALDLFQKSLCIGIVPHAEPDETGPPGKGMLSCRQTPDSPWSAPAGMQMSGGGIIWDLALMNMDVIVLVNARSAPKTMSDPAVIFGVDLSAYPGPVRPAPAAADPVGTGIFAWSISDGDVEPVALGGATMTEDILENERIYGSRLRNKAIVDGSAPLKTLPADVRDFIAVLGKPESAVPLSGSGSSPQASSRGEY
jgi:lipid-binding SYLF domain-containing protein